MSSTGRSIGWLGMGAIGLPMAARAARVGWEVWGYDASPGRRDAARAEGVRIADDPADVGRRADRLVVCLVRSAEQVEDALLGDAGALRAAPGRVGIVMSSVGAEALRALASAHGDAALVDAPILGGAADAPTGDLTIVASGDRPHLDAAAPLLADLAASVMTVGERVGAGQATKVVSQLLQVVGMLATIEGVRLAEGHGVAEQTLLDVLDATAPSWTTGHWGYARDLWERRDPATSLGLFAKDLAAALTDAEAAGVTLPVTAAARRVIDARLGAEIADEL